MHSDITTKIVLALCLLCSFFLPPANAHQTAGEIARQYITRGGFQVGEEPLLQYRAEKLFIPASTLKILTSLLALKKLGTDFRFTTRLYLDAENNLYIKGGGDPFLTSEAVFEICRRFRKQHPQVKQINAIFLDNSYYRLNGWQVSSEHSANPYDAPNGALAVNFNSLPINVAADGTISSGEDQTPLLPIMVQKAKQLHLAPGKYRININYRDQAGYTSALLYAGELFAAQLKNCAIKVDGTPQEKEVPAGLAPALVWQSDKTLQEMTALLLYYSNNFIANQIFLAVGARQQERAEHSSTWTAARRQAASFFYNTLHIPKKELVMVEGSGLSPDNKITCRAFITVLNAFHPWAELLPQQDNILLKSGTMADAGIFCYAGYFIREKKHIPYVLLLNQQKNSRKKLLQSLRDSVP